MLKGILVVLAFIFLAYIFKMNTILWIISKLSNVLIIGVMVIFQTELRKMLEQLGQKKIMATLIPFDTGKEVKERFTDKTINELVKACFDMGEVKTGALIVIEQENHLSEYERTGINIDAVLTSQLLINIFEHNTPLHDGAVIVRGNRVAAATCYLPLSDNMELSKQLGTRHRAGVIFEHNTPLHDGAVIVRGNRVAAATCYLPLSDNMELSKQLGTRHRAGVGISEVSDSLTIIVSEETGNVSIAQGGRLTRCMNSAGIRSALIKAQNKTVVENGKLRNLLKGRVKHEDKTTK